MEQTNEARSGKDLRNPSSFRVKFVTLHGYKQPLKKIFLFCDKRTNYKARLYNGTLIDSTGWDCVSGSLKDTGKKLLQNMLHKTQIKLLFHIKETITILYACYIRPWLQYYL